MDEIVKTEQADDEVVELSVTFAKPYHFEGEVFKGVDLSGLEDITADDMIAADRYLSNSGSFTLMPEMSLGYAMFIAARVTGKPIEFFRRLPAKEALKVKNRVTNFFYGEG